MEIQSNETELTPMQQIVEFACKNNLGSKVIVAVEKEKDMIILRYANGHEYHIWPSLELKEIEGRYVHFGQQLNGTLHKANLSTSEGII